MRIVFSSAAPARRVTAGSRRYVSVSRLFGKSRSGAARSELPQASATAIPFASAPISPRGRVKTPMRSRRCSAQALENRRKSGSWESTSCGGSRERMNAASRRTPHIETRDSPSRRRRNAGRHLQADVLLEARRHHPGAQEPDHAVGGGRRLAQELQDAEKVLHVLELL